MDDTNTNILIFDEIAELRSVERKELAYPLFGVVQFFGGYALC